jgi:hypothetical protein
MSSEKTWTFEIGSMDKGVIEDMKKTSCPDLASISAIFDAEMLTPVVSNEDDTTAILFLFLNMCHVSYETVRLQCYII